MKNYSTGWVILGLLFLSACLSFSSTATQTSLESAITAFNSKQYSQAIEGFQAVSADHDLYSYSQFLLAQSYFKAGKYREADRLARKLEEDSQLLPVEVQLLRGEILLEIGELERALSFAQEAFGSAETDLEREKALRLQARAHSRLEKPGRLLTALLELTEVLDLRFIGEERDQLFESIDRSIEQLQRPDASEFEKIFQYIQTITRFGRYQKARELLNQFRDEWPSELRLRVWFELGYLAGFRLDRKPEARVRFNHILRSGPPPELEAKTRYYSAILYKSEDETEKARESLHRLARSDISSYYSGLAASELFSVQLRQGDRGRAAEILQEFRATLQSRGLYTKSLWELFFFTYWEDNEDEADRLLRLLESYEGQRNPKLQFWKYKLAQRRGNESEIILQLVQALNEEPLSYYSFLARSRGWDKGLAYSYRGTGSDSSTGDIITRIEQNLQDKRAKDLFRKATSLAEYGLFEPAIARLVRLAPSVDQKDYLSLLGHWKEANGDARAALHHGISLVKEILAGEEKVTFSALSQAYPIHFREPIVETVEQKAISATAVLAVIRQESAFEERAYSVSGARGLMQLMPSTAGYIAEDLNKDIATDDLFDPQLNLEFGSYYLALQHEQWDDLRRAMMAYHGGPGNLGRWSEAYDTEDTDLFIELIPRASTQNYVKQVYRNYLIYSYLWKE
ncbi:MAG: transglycosylase SLT domain-containing protein [Candidatus Acetothermia bacterium]